MGGTMKQDKKTTDRMRVSANKVNKWKTIAITMFFILGLGIFSYPIISNIIYERAAKRVIQNFDAAVSHIEDDEIKGIMKLANAYNYYLSGENKVGEQGDSYTQEEMKAGIEEYTKMLKDNEQVGHIIIPKISLNAPLYTGTSENVLQNGIGYMEGTSIPVGGNSTHSVLTGHRGLPTAKLFTELDKLEIEDEFYIKNISGTIAYKVDQIKIVEPTELSDLSIVSGQDYVTLLTCTPYMINSHRLLVRGHRIEYVEKTMENTISTSNTNNMRKNLLFGILIILIISLSYIFSKYLKNRRIAKMKLNIKEASSEEKKEID